nr:PREDICTED: V-type proton ATPase 116 kDa subunit a isoform X2 [Bemisia tabaci]
MGTLFRSEEMALCQLFIQPEASYTSVATLGEAGVVQFRDLNAGVNSFQRKFVSEVRRCDEMERKLRYIEVEVSKDRIFVPESNVCPPAPNAREITQLESHLERTESEILELSHNAVNLKSNYLELTELKYVLEKAHAFFQESFCLKQQEGASGSGNNDSLTKALISDESQQQSSRGRLGFVAGVVPRERVPAFERMLWRISRGNVFLRQAELEEPLEDPATGNEIYKTVFVAFFQGEQLKHRVKKVCSGFHASFYQCPSSHTQRQELLKGIKTRLADLNLVLNQTRDHKQTVLRSVAEKLHGWTVQVRKMKAIYHTLNLFNMDVTKKCLIGECWVPVNDLTFIRKTLLDGSKAVGSSIPSFLNVIETNENPPTFHRTNKFTEGFQNLIDSYGIACYREVNPALYTIITFPFLFAVMFGDAGHGAILAIFGGIMIYFEQMFLKKKSNNEIWNIFFGGRYIIFLMGLFSIYTGIIYNDFFSKAVNAFGSSWFSNYNESTILSNSDITLDPVYQYKQYPYPIGVDPVWQISSNKIVFFNSFKMKLSIIFGVVHMIFGVMLSVINHIHFKRKMSIILEFLPQLILLILLFFYMVMLMFMKWTLYGPQNPLKTSPRCAPSILIMFINMMLFKNNEPFPGCDEYMYDNQEFIQRLIVFFSFLCIPVMLFGKPIYLIYFANKPTKRHFSSNGEAHQGIELQESRNMDVETDVVTAETQETLETLMAQTETEQDVQPVEEHEEPSEIFIHQVIHTIEYVLSTVSHTASYLRLWALSLAHAQLSDVLWGMVLKIGLQRESHVGALVLFIMFALWAVFTVAILVMMEGLSAFLHTLRLHWVEFMSKFYTGTGYAFQPFSFKHILESEEYTCNEE